MAELTVGSLSVKSGQKVRGCLDVVDSSLKMPTTIIRGVAEGKTVVITGGVHGGEYPGVETAIRMAGQLQPDDVSGTVVIVHPVNTEAFLARAQYINPLDGQNLNRMFPGRAGGTVSERIAYTIDTCLHTVADFYMDLHGGDIHEALVPFALYSKAGGPEVAEASQAAASLLGVPYVVGSVGTTGTFGAAALRGVPGFLCEIGQCGRWSEAEVTQYTDGVTNVLRHLGVLQGQARDLGPVQVLPQMHGLDSQHDGCWYPAVAPGEEVKQGQKLGEVRDFFANTLSEYYSPVDGVALYVISSLAIVKGAPVVAVG